MNRKFLVLAMASAFAVPALAQSNVTITGKVAVNYKSFKVGNNPTRPNMAAENRLDDASSRFILKGTEDLGGGARAYFQIDNRFQADARPNVAGTSQGLADGESFVGIGSKSLGQVGFGKYELHYTEAAGEKYRAASTQEDIRKNIMGVVGGGAWNRIAFNTRSQNVIKYDTPNWNGFSGKLAYSFNPAGNEGISAGVNPAASNYSKGDAWNAAVRYANGPVNVYASYWAYDIEGRGGAANIAADQASYKLGGDYSFAFGLTVGLHYDRSKIKNIVTPAGAIGAAAVGNSDARRTAWMIPVRYNFGSHALHFTYARAGNTTGIVNSGARNWILGYDYALSKRTAVGVYYNNLKNKANGLYQMADAVNTAVGGSGLVAGESQRQFSVGISHSF